MDAKISTWMLSSPDPAGDSSGLCASLSFVHSVITDYDEYVKGPSLLGAQSPG